MVNFPMGHFLSPRSAEEAEEEYKTLLKGRVGSWAVSLPKNTASIPQDPCQDVKLCITHLAISLVASKKIT